MEPILTPNLYHNAFNLIAAVCANEGVSIDSPNAFKVFSAKAEEAWERARNNPTMLYGIRTQEMFKETVAGLGKVSLLKQEDGAVCYALDPTLEIPDYRVVFADGQQCLIEVKNFYPKELEAVFKVDADLMEGWERYAKLTGGSLKVAVYYAKFNTWSLLSPTSFTRSTDSYNISWHDAMKRNEMVLLGDMTLGCEFPLRLETHVRRTDSTPLEPDQPVRGELVRTSIYVNDRLITDPLEGTIALNLLLFGGWELEERARLPDANTVISILEAKPIEVDPGQGFAMFKSLSSMFARRYLAMTSDDSGKRPVQIHLLSKPGQLGRLVPEPYEGKVLKLWRFTMQPNFET